MSQKRDLGHPVKVWTSQLYFRQKKRAQGSSVHFGPLRPVIELPAPRLPHAAVRLHCRPRSRKSYRNLRA